MKYEVEVHKVITERVVVEATNAEEAMNMAGNEIHDGDYEFDGMPEYKFTVRQIVEGVVE